MGCKWPLPGLPRLLSCLSPHSLPRRCMQSQTFKHQSGASHSHIYSFIPSTSPKLLTEHFHLDSPQVVSDCLCPKNNSSLFTPQPPLPPVTHSPTCSFQKQHYCFFCLFKHWMWPVRPQPISVACLPVPSTGVMASGVDQL